MSGLIKYREERAAEDAAFRLDVVPTRLCRVLLPVWRADVEADIHDSEPYDLIDRYLEAALARGGLASAAELSQFYGLDIAVVSSAVRFLESIGHLSRSADGRLTLTEIGFQSVREGKRYVRRVRDRRQLYFDGFTRQPLTRAYYDQRTVAFLDGAELARLVAATGYGNDAFTPVMPIPSISPGPGQVAALAQLPAAKRDHFNLPEQVMRPELRGDPEQVYLPAYVIRAVDAGGVVSYLAYTQVSQESDPEWSQVCAVAEEIAMLVENEYQSGRRESDEKRVRRWVEKVYSGEFDVGWRGGLLIAPLPAEAFDGSGDRLKPRRIGSFVSMGGWFFRLWCADEQLRCLALLDLAQSYLGRRSELDPDAAASRLTRFCRQVGFRPLSPTEIGHLARNDGRGSLADQLDQLSG